MNPLFVLAIPWCMRNNRWITRNECLLAFGGKDHIVLTEANHIAS